MTTKNKIRYSKGAVKWLWEPPFLVSPYGYIYLIRNTVNGKVYVGQTTTTVAARWTTHLSHSRVGEKKYPLYNAIRKYGADAFSVTALTSARDRIELDLKERILIRSYRAMTVCGYNCRGGGYAGGRLSEETKAKIGAANAKRVLTPEQRKRIGDVQRGRKQSAETIAKRTAGQLGRKMPPRSAEYIEKQRQAKLGTKQSEETKQRRAAANRGRKNTPETKEKMRMAAQARAALTSETMRRIAITRNTPEYREKMRQAALRRVARPDYALFGRKKTANDQPNLFTDLAS